MKLTTNQITKMEATTTWDETLSCVVTRFTVQASVLGEANAQLAKLMLTEPGELYLTLSSAPVRAVKKDAPKPKGTGKRTYRKREAMPAKLGAQGVDYNEVLPPVTEFQPDTETLPAKHRADKPMFDLTKKK